MEAEVEAEVEADVKAEEMLRDELAASIATEASIAKEEASVVKQEAAVTATGLILLGGSGDPSPFVRKVLAHRVNTTTARIMSNTVLVSRNIVSSHPEYARNASW